MYTVITHTYLLDAQLDQLTLRQHGIESFITDEHTATVQWLYTNALGGIRLKVVDSDAEEAFEILKPTAYRSSDTIACPKCDSTRNFRMKMAFWSFPLYLAGLFFPLPSSNIICMGCGAKIKTDKKQ